MCPLIVREEGRPVLAAGGSGGRRIMAAVLQVVTYVTEFGMSPDAAAHYPRLDVSSPDAISVDPRMAPEIVEALRRSGACELVEHSVFPVNYACPNLIVQRQGGTRTGISDAVSPWSAAVVEAG
jgi:gamma-glutamyltranspeptidase/glutathione hydrolase